MFEEGHFTLQYGAGVDQVPQGCGQAALGPGRVTKRSAQVGLVRPARRCRLMSSSVNRGKPHAEYLLPQSPTADVSQPCAHVRVVPTIACWETVRYGRKSAAGHSGSTPPSDPSQMTAVARLGRARTAG